MLILIKISRQLLCIFIFGVIFIPEKMTAQKITPSAEIKSAGGKQKRIVFLITRDSLNYEADRTIPLFADFLAKSCGYATTVIEGKGGHSACEFPNLDLSHADLLVLFCRRIALPASQMNMIRDYLGSGRPLIGIRTTNHVFSPMEQPIPGFVAWPGFPDSVLGCKNRGYGPVGPGIQVSIAPGAGNHFITRMIDTCQWVSKGNIYKVSPLLDSNITVLLNGKEEDLYEPVAWTRKYGRSKIFYTTLGVPDDFDNKYFRLLLLGAVRWALDKKL